MFCGKCGAVLPDDAMFCLRCGTAVEQAAQPVAQAQPMMQPVAPEAESGKAPKAKKPKGKGKFFLGLLAGVLCSAIVSVLLLDVFAEPRFEGSGYDSPEEALTAYLEALRENDADAMLATFAIESYAKNFDFEAYFVEGHAWFEPSYSYGVPSLPTDTEYGYRLAVEQRAAALAEDIATPYFMLAEGAFEDLEEFLRDYKRQFYTFKDDAERQEITEKYNDPLWEKILREMEFGKPYPDPKAQELRSKSEKYEELLQKYAEGLGADAYEEYVARVEIDGREYLMGMCVVCYDGTWFNLDFGTTSTYAYGNVGFAEIED